MGSVKEEIERCIDLDDDAPYAFIAGDEYFEKPTEFREAINFTVKPRKTAPGWQHSKADPVFTRNAVEYIESREGSARPFSSTSRPRRRTNRAFPRLFPISRGEQGDLVWLFD